MMKSLRIFLPLLVLVPGAELLSWAFTPPLLKSVSPGEISAGSSGFTLVVEGQNFDRGSVVLCNGSPRPTTWVDSHTLQALLLAPDIAQPGTLQITVLKRTMVSNAASLTIHSSSTDATNGFRQFDTSIHDSSIHDVRGDGINFATVDPSKGKIETYNNVVAHSGLGVTLGDESNYACIYFARIANRGVPGTGTARVFNHTFYDCGSRGNGGSGILATSSSGGSFAVDFINDIVLALGAEPYFGLSSLTLAGKPLKPSVTGSPKLPGALVFPTEKISKGRNDE